MQEQRQAKKVKLIVWAVLLILLVVQVSVFGTPRKLAVKLKGVYDSKITLTPFDGVRFASPLAVAREVKAGGEVQFVVPDSLLPGEFLISFDYRSKETDSPYPSELQLYMNRENINVEANPLFLHGDSLRFVGDRENSAWLAFMNKSEQQRRQLGLLRQLLEQYDSPASPEWASALRAYEKRRITYNRWVDSLAHAQRDLYVSHLYDFQKLRAENWKASPAARLEALAHQWFTGVDFNDTLVLRSRQMNELMNGFIALYGTRATTLALRDSLFTEAGKAAIRLASAGHPQVYGWMVDYFYNGYETYNITSGMKMLESHLNNPRCMTRKRLAIAKRLEGMKTMVPGVKVRNVQVNNYDDKEQTIIMTRCDKDFHLLLFYDSECDHCRQLLIELRKWYAIPANSAQVEVVSVSVDQSLEAWKKAFTINVFPWMDRYAPGGINSQAATDYYVLSAPYMYLVDKNGAMVGIPNTVEEMSGMMKKD